MLKSEYHEFELVKSLLLPIFQKYPKRFRNAIKQLKEMKEPVNWLDIFDVVQRHSGYAYIPVSDKHLNKRKKSEGFRMSNVFIENDRGKPKELQAYFLGTTLIGIEIKEDLERLKIDTLDFSEVVFLEIPKNPYFIQKISLEGEFEQIPEILKYLDDVHESEEYLVNGSKLYRIIAFDDKRCICINQKNQIFKVNFSIPAAEKIANDFHSFLIRLKREENYIFKLFGEYHYS